MVLIYPKTREFDQALAVFEFSTEFVERYLTADFKVVPGLN